MALTRRTFFKTTAVALGATAVGACAEPGVSYPPLQRASAKRQTVVDSPAAHALRIVITHAADEPLPGDAEERVRRRIEQMNDDLLDEIGMAIRHAPKIQVLTLRPAERLRALGGTVGTVGGVAEEIAQRVPEARTHVFHFGSLLSASGSYDDLSFGLSPRGGRCAVVGMDLRYENNVVYDRYDNDEDLLEGDSFTSLTGANLALHEALHLFDVEHVDYGGDVMSATGVAGEEANLDILGTYMDRVVRDPAFMAPRQVQERLDRQWADHADFLGRVERSPQKVDGGWVQEGRAGAVFASRRSDHVLLGERYVAWSKNRELGAPTDEPQGRMVRGELRYVQPFKNGKITVDSTDHGAVVDIGRGLSF